MKAGELDYILYRHNPYAVVLFGYTRIIFSFILCIQKYYCFTNSRVIFECNLTVFIFTNIRTLFLCVFSKLLAIMTRLQRSLSFVNGLRSLPMLMGIISSPEQL